MRRLSLLFLLLSPIFLIGQDTSYKARWQEKGGKNELLLDYHHSARVYIEKFIHRKKATQVALGKMDYYFPYFDSVLKKNGIPVEFKYFAFAHTLLDFAYFDTLDGARGIWHFNYTNAKLYDLKITSYIDERRSVEKSTRAFVKGMKALYAIYKDWKLALAAYTSSATKVNKAIRYNGNSTDYWSLRHDLEPLSSEAIPRLIAAMYICQFYEAHGLKPVTFIAAQAATEIQVNDWLSLSILSVRSGVSLDVLEFLNPQYKRLIIPDVSESLPLKVPAQLKDSTDWIRSLRYEPYEATYYNHDEVEEEKVPQGKKTIHKVEGEETLEAIAQKYACKAEEIREWNDLENDALVAGQELVVYDRTVPEAPKVEEDKPKPEPKKVPPPAKKARIHVVKKGETLSGIASKYRVGVTELRKWNNIKGNTIYTGQKLKIY